MSTPWKHVGGVDVLLHSFLTSAFGGGGVVNITTWPLFSRQRIGDWMGPAAGLDVLDERKVSCSSPDWSPRTVQTVAWSPYRLRYPAPTSFSHFRRVRKKMRKSTISCVLSVCPYGTTMLPLNGLSYDWYISILRKSVEKIQVSLKFYTNKGYFKWGPIYIFNHISLVSS